MSVGDKLEDSQRTRMEEEGMLEMQRWGRNTVGIRVAVVVGAIVALCG
jgi:hypothetical protein